MKTLFASTYTQCHYDHFDFRLTIDGKMTDVREILPPDREPITMTITPDKAHSRIPRDFGFQVEDEWITEEQMYNPDYFFRFLSFYMRDGFDGDPRENEHRRNGLYDYEKRRVIVEPSEKHFLFFEDLFDDAILVIESTGERREKTVEYLIGYDGKVLYPWLYDGRFDEVVSLPNRRLFTVVDRREPVEVTDPDAVSDESFVVNGHTYYERLRHGVVAPSENPSFSPDTTIFLRLPIRCICATVKMNLPSSKSKTATDKVFKFFKRGYIA